MSEKKVHFSTPIHYIEYLDKHWAIASRHARDGSDWLRMGLDRQRFRDRIEKSAEILDKVLDFEFRQEIYQQRFENFVIPDQQEALRREESTKLTTTSKQIIESVIDNTHHQNQQEQQQNSLSQQQPPQKQPQQNSQRRKNNKRRKHRGRHRKKK